MAIESIEELNKAASRPDAIILPAYRIPTKGMKRIEPAVMTIGGALKPKLRLTTFYEDFGQLRWCYGRDVKTTTYLFIQNECGEVFFRKFHCGTNNFELMNILDPNVKAEVIKCEVPNSAVERMRNPWMRKMGALMFMGERHPVEFVQAVIIEIVVKLFMDTRQCNASQLPYYND